MDVRDNPAPTEAAEAFCHAAVECGYQGPYADHNAGQHENAAGMFQFTVTPEMQRASAAVAFLNPIRQRRNLTIEPARSARGSSSKAAAPSASSILRAAAVMWFARCAR